MKISEEERILSEVAVELKKRGFKDCTARCYFLDDSRILVYIYTERIGIYSVDKHNFI